MVPLTLTQLPPEILTFIMRDLNQKELLSLYRTSSMLRMISGPLVNKIFQKKIELEFPSKYIFLNKLDGLNRNSFSRYMSFKTIQRAPEVCDEHALVATIALYVNEVIAIGVLGFIIAKGILVMEAKTKANWIQNYLNSNPGATVEQALQAYKEWSLKIARSFGGRP